MACGSCVEKLARRLIANHSRLDLIRAFELAEKAVERHEAHKPKSVEFRGVRSIMKEEEEVLGFDPDYSAACSSSGACSCYGLTIPCAENPDCLNPNNSCACSCPSPPKAHSHYVNNTCVSTQAHNCACNRSTMKCYGSKICRCTCSGQCYYTCDEGYVWNPTTQQCEPSAARQARLLGDSLTSVTC